jgi:hypothetical protein
MNYKPHSRVELMKLSKINIFKSLNAHNPNPSIIGRYFPSFSSHFQDQTIHNKINETKQEKRAKLGSPTLSTYNL